MNLKLTFAGLANLILSFSANYQGNATAAYFCLSMAVICFFLAKEPENKS